MAVGWYALHGSTAAIFREGNMKQETTWLVLGQEWRDTAIMLLGTVFGALIGGIFVAGWYEKQQRKQK